MFNERFSPEAAQLRPGIAGGYYPERPQNSSGWLQKAVHSLAGVVKSGAISRRKMDKIVGRIHHHSHLFEKLDDEGMRAKTREIRRQLHQRGLTENLTSQAFALVREIAGRTINMRHFDSQLMGGWIMVHGGLAEMETGEGKTLTAVLAAATAALAGIPVHIITVNDYLVSRDAKVMSPVYQALGLSIGAVTATMDEVARRSGYGCDITYCTNKQLAFDYLRDRILLGNDHGRMRLQLEKVHDGNARAKRLFLRGLCFAIVDEADSVLIDEAITPLIISRESEGSEEKETYLQAMAFAKNLEAGRDFEVDQRERQTQLSEEGSKRLAEAAKVLGGIWSGMRRREELVCQALSAEFLYLRDRHYLVQDDKVMIVDENTGRVMADRSWERGLHQMIEIKEGCEVTAQREHLARLTYQRFFRRYLRLAGMTGTAREVHRELWSVYGLQVLRVPTNKPSRRKDVGHHVYQDQTEKWTAVVRHVKKMQQSGRPTLVGTRSVGDSEHLSKLLHSIGIVHQVLNARQDESEAEIVGRAGEKGCVTVATNMAGRGTDIPLGRGVAELGGLHVISTERNEAQRIDRQLYGRCGRQGDPGSYESILSLDDELLAHHLSDFLRVILNRLVAEGKFQSLAFLAMRQAQSARERRYLRMRRDLLQVDEQLGRLLAFSGRME
ncbi:preprotein translocase subunit SecA [Desulforhopalus sp. IMCC35007]|uniref:preprotein translocase subunit SecA n=1 Tax=Desulforhopalus sp. IMCC35007 TaxID=2569543 RepID=UPI0010ADB8C4|nr:preprotein translocase subunit SecA [Desulforhopalus sp. IMCC35007]TKB06037.1 prepilin peptidase [Desulforhopalus sp. IMCC35007]